MARADRDRWLALGLLLAVIGLAYLLVVHPLFTVPLREADARIADLRGRDARVRSLLLQRPQIEQRLAELDARGGASGFLAEPTTELATAALIQQLERVVGEASPGNRGCAIVNRGHKRRMDLAIEVPGSPLEAVMSHEVWQEIYEKLVAHIEAHRTTLIFVNTRRLAERMAHQLSDRIGADNVAAHHGSLAKEARLTAEARLRGTVVMLAAAGRSAGGTIAITYELRVGTSICDSALLTNNNAMA